MIFNDTVIVRGAGDLASGTIYKLHRSGFRVLALELPQPTSIRRQVSFSEAVYEGEMEIEGVRAVLVDSKEEILSAWRQRSIPVAVDPKGLWIDRLKPGIVVDGMVAKKNLGTSKDMAAITIALGPGFIAGKDVDAVIETNRGHDLGRLIFEGEAARDTGTPGIVGGYAKERVIYSPVEGIIENIKDIGMTVEKNDTITYVAGEPIKAEISGLIRGIIRDGSRVRSGMKIADVDPRIDERDNCYRISDKARNIAGGVLEAILILKNNNDSVSNEKTRGC